MSGMPDSLPFWIGAAIALFWFVGAYNRIVRLRSAALQAYAALDAALVRQLDFVQARVAQALAEGEGAGSDDPRSGASLKAAADQLVTLLAATRLHPLEPAGIAALGTALHVMLAAWQRLHPEAVVSFEADGTLSRPVPLGDREEVPNGHVPIAWPEPSAAAEIARGQFNLAVGQYNAAITQFPAQMVAWIMQLRLAAPLR
ncbi:MAG: lema family protein [Variovorax sp.]|nr:MAG: lema family protein [Variovorax sp.]